MDKTLFYGDNLKILSDEFADETVDLIYLDPPFNSKAAYNVLFRTAAGDDSEAQIHAFEDTWRWSEETEEAYDRIIRGDNTNVTDLIVAMRVSSPAEEGSDRVNDDEPTVWD